MKILVTDAISGLVILRSLARAGHEIIGADERRLPLNIHSKYTKPYYLLPSSATGAFVEAILNIIRLEKPDVILPVMGTKILSKYRAEIEQHTRILIPSHDSVNIASDNQKTLEECRAVGIPTPRLFSYAEALKVLTNSAEAIHLVVKPRADIGGAAGVFFVNDFNSLNVAKDYTESRYGATVIQEFIPGPTDCMRTVNLLFDRESRLAAYFTTRKLRQWPTTGGITALSISTNDWDLVKTVLPFFHKFKWQGLVEVELKVDPRDGILKVIEINPRCWSYISFPIHCGVHLPEIACRLAFDNQPLATELPNYLVGIKYINLRAFYKTLRADLQYDLDKFSVIKNAFIDLRGKKVSNKIEFRDFMPTVGKILLKIQQRYTSNNGYGHR